MLSSMSRPSEPTKEPECDFALRGVHGEGALTLLDRVQKLKEKAGAYVSQFISNGSQSVVE
jgi:uncharacterized protein (UPF0262 family)